MAVFRKKSRVGGEIPTSSMADIAFLLLIFFLVTTIFDEEKGLPMVLPEQAEQQEIPQNNILHFFVQPDGVIEVQRGESSNRSVHSHDEVESIWRLEFSQNPNLIAAVKTHPDAAYEHMINVLDELQSAGASRVSLQVLEE
ncbi:MAG: ExbD/TolR family protein [Gemmatimonadota bacterium]